MRTLLTFFVVSVISFSSCGQKEKKTAEKTKTNLIALPEKPLNWVSDFEGILKPSEIIYLDSIIELNEKQTTNQIAVVTLDFDSAYLHTIENYEQVSLRLFRQWGVGLKDKNNGIGILISPQLKMVRIEVGLGLEKKLTDEEAKIIIDSFFIPEFKKGNYYIGIKNGLQEVFKETK